MRKNLLVILLTVPLVLCGQGFANRNLLGGQGKTAAMIKKEKAKKRSEASKVRAVNKAKSANLKKVLDIKGLAGYKFGDACESVSMMRLKKPSFGRYTYISLESSPVAGLCAITLTTTDPLINSEDDVKKEIARIARIFGDKFKVSFTSEIKKGGNQQYGHIAADSPYADSVTGGIRGYRREIQTVETVPATKHFFTLVEDFANCSVKIEGIHDLVERRFLVNFTIRLTKDLD